MNDLNSAWQQILINPHDLALRLVYADMLDEEGKDQDLAEYIRTELALHYNAHDPVLCNVTGTCRRCSRYEALQRRGHQLFANNWRRWVGGIDWSDKYGDEEDVTYGDWGGLVGVARCDLERWLAIGKAVCRTHPVVKLHLTDKRPTPGRWDEWNTKLAYGFYQDGAQHQAGVDYCLPPAVFDAIENAVLCHGNFANRWKTFPSAAAGQNELGECLLNAARTKARLPRLERYDQKDERVVEFACTYEVPAAVRGHNDR